MIKAIALAGATAALVIGSIAIAQTATNPNANANPPATSTTPATTNDGMATSAGQYGANTSATNPNGMATDNTGQAAGGSMATGERG
jgi:hypothetical protein